MSLMTKEKLSYQRTTSKNLEQESDIYKLQLVGHKGEKYTESTLKAKFWGKNYIHWLSDENLIELYLALPKKQNQQGWNA